MSNNRFIKFIPSEAATKLMESYPFAFLLLCLIAQRARRTKDEISGLEVGESLIGDYEAIGGSERNYRTAKEVLCRIHAIEIVATCRKPKKVTTSTTTKSTTRGTKVRLLNSEFWDINILDVDDLNDDLNDDLPTTCRRLADDEQESKESKEGKESKASKSNELEENSNLPLADAFLFDLLIANADSSECIFHLVQWSAGNFTANQCKIWLKNNEPHHIILCLKLFKVRYLINKSKGNEVKNPSGYFTTLLKLSDVELQSQCERVGA